MTAMADEVLTTELTDQAGAPPRLFGPVVATAVAAAIVWAYWASLASLWNDWQQDPNYSAGQLVPVVALWLVWRRRSELAACPIRPSLWGLAGLLLAQIVRLAGLLFLYESIERYSIILTIAACVWFVAGWRMLVRLRWVLVFCLLMAPLPGRLHNLISGPLQTQATAGAVFMLEVVGVSVIREGHTLILANTVPLAVAEACNGLRMLTAFVVVAATLAFVIDRPRWQKAVIVVSSVPIAIGANLMRLFITAELYMHADSETAERFFHDFAGVSMMPLAVALLAGELWLLSKLICPLDAADG